MFLDEMKGTTGCQEKQCYSYVNYTYTQHIKYRTTTHHPYVDNTM